MDIRRTSSEEPGLPWSRLPIDQRDMDRHLRRARRMHAEAVAETLASLCRGAARLWRDVRTRLEAARGMRRERRRVHRELAAYRDRELDELGVRRSDIPAIAAGRPTPWAAG